MTTTNHVVDVALEWWRASGERSEARLRLLTVETGNTYAFTGDRIAEAVALAKGRVMAHERAAGIFHNQ